MVKETTRKGISEVLYILKNTLKSDVEKIPEKFMNFLNSNALEGYEPNFELKADINEMDISLETKCILAIIYKEYWCTPEEKVEFEAILDKNEIARREAEKDKYDLSKVLNKEPFAKPEVDNRINEQTIMETELGVVTVSDSPIIRWWNSIKGFFYKIFKK